MKKTKQPIDYSKGKIYKIWSFNTDEIYIGSTIQALSERLRGHERSLKCHKKTGKKYCVSFIILENEHYDIELIEYCPCKTKDELCRREGELQREIECVNQKIAGRTGKEYYEENKEPIAKRKKIRIICECGTDIAKADKARHIKTLLHIKLMEEKKNYIKLKIVN